MDPRYEELLDIIDEYGEIDETNEKYNYFGTWAMCHFSDVCTRGDVYIQELLKETWALKHGNITQSDIKCNDEEHCYYIQFILDAYNELFLEDEYPNPNWAS